MEFILGCPHCSQHLSISEEWAGVEVQCPTCASTFVVPAPDESSIPGEQETLIDPSAEPTLVDNNNALVSDVAYDSLPTAASGSAVDTNQTPHEQQNRPQAQPKWRMLRKPAWIAAAICLLALCLLLSLRLVMRTHRDNAEQSAGHVNTHTSESADHSADDKVSVPPSEAVKDEPRTKSDETGSTSPASNPESSASSTSTSGSETSADVSPYRRGPTIKGFQIGMTADEFRQNLNNIYPGLEERLLENPRGTRGVGDPIYDPLLNAGEHLYLTRFSLKNGYVLAEVKTIGESGPSLEIFLEDKVISKMFRLGGMSVKDFCQNLINAYDIPTLEAVPGDSYGVGAGWLHKSEDGWMIFINTFGSVKLHITRLREKVDHGFGE